MGNLFLTLLSEVVKGANKPGALAALVLMLVDSVFEKEANKRLLTSQIEDGDTSAFEAVLEAIPEKKGTVHLFGRFPDEYLNAVESILADDADALLDALSAGELNNGNGSQPPVERALDTLVVLGRWASTVLATREIPKTPTEV